MRINNLAEIQEALDLRRHGHARPLDYRVSHQWFILRITAPDLAGNFHLLCGACERVEFDTHWGPLNIRVERDGDDFLVHDGAHLRVRCGLLAGEYNVPPVFGLR